MGSFVLIMVIFTAPVAHALDFVDTDDYIPEHLCRQLRRRSIQVSTPVQHSQLISTMNY